MLKFDFRKSFEENTSDMVVTHKAKGKILKFSNNYHVLLALYNQKYLDNYKNKCIKPNGRAVNNTVQRCWDLEHKFNIEGIKSEWVDDGENKGYKRYWLSRK